jgi:hypothetical protein
MLIERLFWSDVCNSTAQGFYQFRIWGKMEGGGGVFYEDSILSLTESPFFALLPATLHYIQTVDVLIPQLIQKKLSERF